MRSTRDRQSGQWSIFEPLEQRRLLSAGDLDPFFGVNGMVDGAVGFRPNDVAIAPDGKLVVVGRKNDDFGVARLNADNSLDTTFGGDGVVTTNFGGNRDDTARGVAVQPDGKIVVVGERANFSSFALGDQGNIAIARYNTDGSLDATFDNDGKREIDFGRGSSRAHDVAIMPDGRIVVVGTFDDTELSDSTDPDFAVMRLNPDGSLDRTFGSRDNAFSQQRSGKTKFGFGSDDSARALVLLPDGGLVVGGTRDPDNGLAKFALAKLRSNGTLDKNFDNDGKLTTEFADDAFLRALALGPGGRIIAAGSSDGSFALARYRADGSLDGSFGMAGRVVTDIAPGVDTALAVLHTPDNKIIAGGTAAGVGAGEFALARYNHNGSLDTAFGNGGKVLTAKGSDAEVHALHITPDGKLMMGGVASGSGVMARYLHFVPEVNIFRLTATLAEHDTKDGTFMITRDQREDFTTRVYYTIGGNAYPDADFTIDPGPNQRYVDILPNETFSLVKINTIDDAEVEPTQTVTLQLLPKDHYSVGSRDMASIKIRDNDVMRINFQPDGSPVPAGYKADTGAIFADRGNGYRYGWDADNSAQTRDRDILTDQRFDTLTHLQKNGADRDWRLAVANGSYNVRVASSDPEFFDGHWRINVEGTLALDHVPTSSAFSADNSVTINVTGSRLNLTNASGAINNKLAFIELRSSEFVAPPPRPVKPIGGVLAPIGPTTGGGSSGSSWPGLVVPISELVFSQQPIGSDEVSP